MESSANTSCHTPALMSGNHHVAGPASLHIQWCSEGYVWKFDIELCGLTNEVYVLQIVCSPWEFYNLKFMFENDETQKDLAKLLLKWNYQLQNGKVFINLGSDFQEQHQTLTVRIEEALKSVKSTIQVHSAKTNFCDASLIEKCKKISIECQRGNIMVWLGKERVWLVGRNEAELKKLGKSLVQEHFIECEDLIQTFPPGKQAVYPLQKKPTRKVVMLSIGTTQDEGEKGNRENRDDASADVYRNDLQKKPQEKPKCEEKSSRINFTFISGKKKYSKEMKSTGFQFKKWTFLMTSKEPKANLQKDLGDIQTEIKLGAMSPCFTVEVSSQNHESDFDHWVEECFQVTEDCFRDLELLSVDGPQDKIKHLSQEIEKSRFSNSVSKFEMKDVGGIFLLSGGENLIDLILDLQTHFENTRLQNPESKEDIKYSVVDITPMLCQQYRVFQMISQTRKKYPYVKIYHRGEMIRLLGNGCDDAITYLNNGLWMEDVQSAMHKQFEISGFFFSRESVQKFIDRKISRISGTWGVHELTEPPKTELILVYGKTSLIRKKECIIKSPRTEDEEKWRKCAESLAHSCGGKFNFSIEKNSGNVAATFIFTSDVENEERLKMLINEVELQIERKEAVPMSRKQLIWLQKFYTDALQTEAKKNESELRFTKDRNEIEIVGTSSAVTEMKKTIHSICMEEQDILVPFQALPREVIDFLGKYQCCFQYALAENSRFWKKENTAIVHYKGKLERHRLYADVYVKSLLSENGDSNIKWSDETTILLKLQLGYEGKKHLTENMLPSLFREMGTEKKISLAFDLEELTSEAVLNLVKCIMDCIPKPPESLIIILCHTDEAVAMCIEEEKSPQTKTGSPRIDLQVIQGNIAEIAREVDVIVNTTSQDLDITKGVVSASILKGAGDGLKREIATYPAINKGSPIIRVKYGDVVETLGYRLKCQRIFHGPLHYWKSDQPEIALKVLQNFVRKCISLANERKFKSMAFPAIGTGKLRIPADVVASCVKKIVDEYTDSHTRTHVEKIIFVIYEKDEENFKVFKTILEHAKEKVKETTADVIYRFSVYGEKPNLVGAKDLLMKLFREHIQEKYELANVKHKEVAPDPPQRQNENKTLGKYGISQPSVLGSSKEEEKPALSHDEQHCLVLQSKEGSPLNEENLGPILKDVVECENIICPFLEDGFALIRFKNSEGADNFLKKFANDQYVLKKLPVQVVSNVKAKLSSKVIRILQRKGMTSEEFQEKTGAHLCSETWTVKGSLLMVKNGERYIKELVKELEMFNLSDKLSTTETDQSLPRKYSVLCSEYQEKALRELCPDLPFKNVNFRKEARWRILCGMQKNVTPFENALLELKSKEISPVTEKEFQELVKKKMAGFAILFSREQNTMTIYSMNPEKLQTFCQEFLHASMEMPVADFNIITFFEKNLCRMFPVNNGKVMISGPRSLIEQYNCALEKRRSYTTQRVIISDNVRDEAAVFISNYSSQNDQIYIEMDGITILITSPNRDTVFKAKQEIDHKVDMIRKIKYQIGSHEVQKRSNNSENEMRGLEMDVSKKSFSLVSPQTSDIVYDGKGIRVFALNADLIHVKADAIVNPSDAKLQSPSGLSHAICRAAGHAVQSECHEFIKAQETGTLPIDKTFITEGGNLNHFLKIIHVNMPKWQSYAWMEHPCEACIRDITSTILSCLSECQLIGVKSIAIPIIGGDETESVPLPVCCRAYEKAVMSFIDSHSKRSQNTLKEIYFVERDGKKPQSMKLAFQHKQHWVFHKYHGNEGEYYLATGIVVKIFPCEIIFACADALVVPQDRDMKSEGHVASDIMQCKSNAYGKEIADLRGSYWKTGDVRCTSAPKSLTNISKVLHVFSPWASTETCIKNVFKEATKLKLETIVMPFFGGSTSDISQKKKIFQDTAKILLKCATDNKDSTLQVISMVDSCKYNTVVMNAEFYDILSKDAEQRHKVTLIDVASPTPIGMISTQV